MACGRKRIAFLGDASGHYPEFRDRYLGLCAALRSAGLPIDPGLQVDALTVEESGYEAAQRLLRRDIAFDAIFAGSDMIAIGAMRALEEAGLDVPGDIAIIGFDDIPAAGMTRPGLTTIAQDHNRAAEMLVGTLINQIAQEPADTALLAPRLVVRGTTEPIRPQRPARDRSMAPASLSSARRQ